MNRFFVFLLFSFCCIALFAHNVLPSSGDVLDIFPHTLREGFTVCSVSDSISSTFESFRGWLFHFEWSFWCLFKWVFIAIFVMVVGSLILEIALNILGMGIAVWIMALIVGFCLKWIGFIEPDTMWTMARWGFYAGLCIGVIYVLTNFGNVIDVWSPSSSSEYASGGGGSSSGGSSSGGYAPRIWGEVHVHPNGSKYIVDEDGGQHYVWSEGGSVMYDDQGTKWSTNGNLVWRSR